MKHGWVFDVTLEIFGLRLTRVRVFSKADLLCLESGYLRSRLNVGYEGRDWLREPDLMLLIDSVCLGLNNICIWFCIEKRLDFPFKVNDTFACANSCWGFRSSLTFTVRLPMTTLPSLVFRV